MCFFGALVPTKNQVSQAQGFRTAADRFSQDTVPKSVDPPTSEGIIMGMSKVNSALRGRGSLLRGVRR